MPARKELLRWCRCAQFLNPATRTPLLRTHLPGINILVGTWQADGDTLGFSGSLHTVQETLDGLLIRSLESTATRKAYCGQGCTDHGLLAGLVVEERLHKEWRSAKSSFFPGLENFMLGTKVSETARPKNNAIGPYIFFPLLYT